MLPRSFCLSLPSDLYTQIKEISSSRSCTITAYIRAALCSKVSADLSGQRYCTSGEPCILGYLPNLREHAITAKILLEEKAKHKTP